MSDNKYFDDHLSKKIYNHYLKSKGTIPFEEFTEMLEIFATFTAMVCCGDAEGDYGNSLIKERDFLETKFPGENFSYLNISLNRWMRFMQIYNDYTQIECEIIWIPSINQPIIHKYI